MSSVFGSFCSMMDRLPAVAAKKAAAKWRRMLEEDSEMGREDSVSEVASVLAFCRFVESAGSVPDFPDVPLEHWSCYEQIIEKLAQAGELPAAVVDGFNDKFGKPGRQNGH